jgi:hypothetical protein
MNDNSSNEAEHSEDLWSDRRAASSLTSSEHDMSDQRKEIIGT